MWSQLSGDARRNLQGSGGPSEDGEFWMSYEDFIKNFTDFEACSVSISELEENEKSKWYSDYSIFTIYKYNTVAGFIHCPNMRQCFFCCFTIIFYFIVKSWNSIIINGEWSNAKGNAGGCRNYPTFVKNPQYIIDLKEDADGDGKCSVLIALMQKHRRKQKKMGVQDLCIGFSIYKVP